MNEFLWFRGPEHTEGSLTCCGLTIKKELRPDAASIPANQIERDAMSWWVYDISPIDCNWDYLPSVEGVAKSLAVMEAEMLVREGKTSFPALSYDEFMEDWTSAQEAARDSGWDGDHREPPRVLWLPVDSAFRPGFAIKQDSSGITYIVSPAPLPSLEELR